MEFHGLSISGGLGPQQEEPVLAHGVMHPDRPSWQRTGDQAGEDGNNVQNTWHQGAALIMAPGCSSPNNGSSMQPHSSIVP